MGNLYLVDKPFGETGLNLAMNDKTAKVVLIQDGVYLDCAPLHATAAEIYALHEDAERRGQAKRLARYVHVIDYGQLVDLIADNKVVNFA